MGTVAIYYQFIKEFSFYVYCNNIINNFIDSLNTDIRLT